ncbi:MAG: hypothetical protein U9R39_03785 [Campylobacterota bacterium]|nr:hypothetical protein [Campylobacterota bacterium]
MEENKTDIKYLLIFLACVAIAIILNIDYLFSTDTMNQIDVVDNVEVVKKDTSILFGEKE